MKILHVETGRHLYGGPQQVVYLVSALNDRGHDCTLVCPPGSGIDSAARAHGVRVQNLFCAGDLDLPFAYRLTQYINETQPAVVHCHSRRGADVLGGLAASFADVPAVVSRRVDNPEMQVMAALRYRPFQRIIAISEAVAGMLRSLGIDAERITVIRDAVDADRFSGIPDRVSFCEKFALPADSFVVGAAGQLIERKGYRFLLDAVAGLAGDHPDLQVLVFGQGELEPQLRAQAASLGLENRVQFPGFDAELDDWMGCFDLFVHPALAEGLGVVTLKAQAAGVSVVASRTGGLPEAIEHDATGLLVPPGDTAALRDAIARLAGDDDERQAFGSAGRERMKQEFSVAAMADRHVALYEALVNE